MSRCRLPCTYGAPGPSAELVRRLNDARVLAVVDRNPRFQADGGHCVPVSPTNSCHAPAAVALGMASALLPTLQHSYRDCKAVGSIHGCRNGGGGAHPAGAAAASGWTLHFGGSRIHSTRTKPALYWNASPTKPAPASSGRATARALDKVSPGRARRRQYAPASLPPWSQPRLVDAGLRRRHAPRLRTKWHKDRAKPLFRTGSGQLRSVAGPRRWRRMMCWPLGLSDEQSRCASMPGTAPQAVPEGDTIIQCVALDETAPHFPATLLKWISKAPNSTLRGAEKLIARSGCAMAISAYHTPDHLGKCRF